MINLKKRVLYIFLLLFLHFLLYGDDLTGDNSLKHAFEFSIGGSASFSMAYQLRVVDEIVDGDKNAYKEEVSFSTGISTKQDAQYVARSESGLIESTQHYIFGVPLSLLFYLRPNYALGLSCDIKMYHSFRTSNLPLGLISDFTRYYFSLSNHIGLLQKVGVYNQKHFFICEIGLLLFQKSLVTYDNLYDARSSYNSLFFTGPYFYLAHEKKVTDSYLFTFGAFTELIFGNYHTYNSDDNGFNGDSVDIIATIGIEARMKYRLFKKLK